MKRNSLLIPLLILIFAANSTVFAQNDEYYRPDSLNKGKTERKEMPPVEQRPLSEPKKNVDFNQQPFKDRVRAGGSFGLSFGTITNINLSPMVGYEITKDLLVGVGLTGMYVDNKFSGVRNAFYYGQRSLLMYKVFPSINLVSELEFLNVEADTYTKYDARRWIVSPMVGASLSQPIGGRLIRELHVALLYNLGYNRQVDDYGVNISPYGRLFGQPLVVRLTFL